MKILSNLLHFSILLCPVLCYKLKMLQNKNNYLNAVFSQTATRYYRSIKYKVSTPSGLKPHHMTQVNFSHNTKLPNQTATSWRRPSSYSVCKKPNAKYSSGKNIQNGEEDKPSELKISYMQTWDSLLNPKQKTKESQQKVKINRVCLPSIIDFEPSNFTSLDPLFLPIQHIERGIIELRKQLPEPKLQMSQIHHDMIIFREKIEKELNQTQQYGIKEFERLRRLLRADKVYFQESNMKFKRNCKDLHQLDQAYKLNFQGTKPRLDDLQIQLFSNKPFELSRNEELDQQFPQKYF